MLPAAMSSRELGHGAAIRDGQPPAQSCGSLRLLMFALPVPLHRTSTLVLISEAAEARRLRNPRYPIKYIKYCAVVGMLERA
jgi:hypothetical protein